MSKSHPKSHPRKTSMVSLITLTALLAVAASASAQPGLTKGKPGQKIILLPQIKAVKSRQSKPGVVPRILPLQTFTIEGRFFHDLRTKNKIHLTGRNAWSMWTVAATVTPISATTTALTAQLPFVEIDHNYSYFLTVEVEGVGTSERHHVEIGEMNIEDVMAKPRLDSVSPAEARQGDLVTLTGFFRGVPRVFFYPTTVGGSPFSLTPSSHTQKRITFKVPPELAAGGYKISVGAEGSPGLTNPPVRFRVVLSPDVTYVLEIDRIKCLKESADGPGSDEIYATVISFQVHTYSDGSFRLAGPVEEGTPRVYTDVDAGEQRQVALELRKFDQASGPVDYLILVGLHESDNADLSTVSKEGWAKASIYGVGEKVMEGVGPKGGHQTHPSSREQLVTRAKLTMLPEIVSSLGDELLGLEELRITQTDMQKAKQLNGAPVMKQLTFKGDDSLYVVDFRFRMVK